MQPFKDMDLLEVRANMYLFEDVSTHPLL